MCEKSGKILMAAVLVGLGVMNAAYPSDVIFKTVRHYSTFVPVLQSLHLNVVLGLAFMLAAVAVFRSEKHAGCLVQTAIVLSIVLQGCPYVPGLDMSEQFTALFSLLKGVAILGGSLLLTK
jgi:hypothetical protein